MSPLHAQSSLLVWAQTHRPRRGSLLSMLPLQCHFPASSRQVHVKSPVERTRSVVVNSWGTAEGGRGTRRGTVGTGGAVSVAIGVAVGVWVDVGAEVGVAMGVDVGVAVGVDVGSGVLVGFVVASR